MMLPIPRIFCASIVLFVGVLVGNAAAAPRTAPFPGLRETSLSTHALVGAKIVVSPERTIDKGTIIIRDGVVAAVGEKIAIPADAQVHDVAGKTIYPGFIDAYTELSPDVSRAAVNDQTGAGYWNAYIVPQARAGLIYGADAGANRKFRGQGITARLVAPSAGIIKGTSVLVTTADSGGKQTILKEPVALHLKLTVARRGGGYPNSPMGAYTLVRQAFYDAGWYGEAWDIYQQNQDLQRPERSDALAVLRGYLGGKQPVIIDASDELFVLRADRISDEFGLNTIVRASGDEFRRLDDVVATHRPLIVPLDFPKAPNVSTPEAAAKVSVERLMQWDLAPENPGRLDAAGVKIAFTSQGLKDVGGFLGAVRKAVERGLSPQAALKALTVTPAEMFGVSERMGTLEPGQSANLIVASGDLFKGKTKVVETWVDGERYETETEPLVDPRGKWTVDLLKPDGAKETVVIEIGGQPGKLSGKAKLGDKSSNLINPTLSQMHFTTSFKGEPLGMAGVVQVAATISKPASGELSWLGSVVWADGQKSSTSARWESVKNAPKPDKSPTPEGDEKKSPDSDKPAKPADAAKPEDATKPDSTAKTDDEKKPADGAKSDEAAKPEAAAKTDEDDDDSPDESPAAEEKGDESAKKDDKPAEAAKKRSAKPKKPVRALAEVNYPLGEYGRKSTPEQPAAVLFRNATVWTCGSAGRLENADVLIERGKITAVGKGLPTPGGALVINATGKHIAPGIIDCHSHIATDGGVNESGQTITAEVRVADFVDPNDINIYRQIAGGVTTSNILHGSSNTIGGQCQVVKFRWGAGPEEMKFVGAAPSIKFALGENVKRSNGGDSSRYPQTRMGVEQLIRDAFRSAQEYRAAQNHWQRTKVGLPPRTDLELEALAEILEGKRLIHCHSYRQDEILAFMRACEDFGVQIATLQHILEGYKVADVMARHGAGGSSFSDWWAYKYEVFDAIPYNGALMHNAGVVVSFNSDDAELGRRLNLEAAKAIRYGGLSPEEALKFVTINPAKQLRVDRHVGSIETGKDADLVVWSHSPLSVYSCCEQTWIDGRRYFDIEEDRQVQGEVRSLHAALVQRILDSGEPVAGPDEEKRRESEMWPREDLFCHGVGHDHEHGE